MTNAAATTVKPPAVPVPPEEEIMLWQTDRGDVQLSIALVRKFFCPDATAVEAMTFMNLCRYQRLNPWLREAYLIKYGQYPATMVVGKETFTKRAERHPKFKGFAAGVIVQLEDKSVDRREGALVLKTETLVGGWGRVWRMDKETPYYIEVGFDEYVGLTKEGDLNRQWRGKPATMIRKVGLVQALREAFPEEFEGLYDEAEIREERHRPEAFEMPLSVAEASAKRMPSSQAETAASSPAGESPEKATVKADEKANSSAPSAGEPPPPHAPHTPPPAAEVQSPKKGNGAGNGKSRRQECWTLLCAAAKKAQKSAPSLLQELTAKSALSELDDRQIELLIERLRSM